MPSVVVTVIWPLVAPDGAVAVSWPKLLPVGWGAITPLNLTVGVPTLKLAPVTVTGVFTGPKAGEKP